MCGDSVGSGSVGSLKEKRLGTNGTNGSLVPCCSLFPLVLKPAGTNGNQREPTEQPHTTMAKEVPRWDMNLRMNNV